jgi:hypothetical protein
MLAQQHNEPGDRQRSKEEVDAEVPRPVHVCEEIVPWFEERSSAGHFKPKRAAPFVLVWDSGGTSF